MIISMIKNQLQPDKFIRNRFSTQTPKTLERQQMLIRHQASIRSIMALQTRYMTHWDQMLNREVGRPSATTMVQDLFTPDGQWIAYIEGDRVKEHYGKVKLIALFESLAKQTTENESSYVKHFSMNPQIEITGDTATKRESFVVFNSDDNKNESGWLIGYYMDELKQDMGGEWRFKSKIAMVENISNWPSKRQAS